jgi:hypothetical protein
LAAEVALTSRPSLAQSADAVTAEALFERGRDLLRSGQAALACPKLAESYRLDPATGTLMALAMCHEAENKLASAWAEFSDTASRAKIDGRADREEAARKRAAALRPRLSSLLVDVPPETSSIAGLEIRRDGVALGSATWGTAIPIDGGRYVVEASAPGRRAFRATVEVKVERDAATVRIPPLEVAPSAGAASVLVAPPVPAPASPAPATNDTRQSDVPPAASRGSSALTIGGVAVGIAGIAAWGVGGYFLATALGEKSDSDPGCDGNACDPVAYDQRKDMVRHGNFATAFGIGGAVLAGAGVTMILLGWPSDDSKAEYRHLRIDARWGSQGALVGVSGEL